MPYFAKIENHIVTDIRVVDEKYLQSRPDRYPGVWLPVDKNYAGIGYTYDEERNAFISPKPYDSWVLDEETCLWEAPVPYPEDGMYTWDEETTSWIEVE